MRALLCLVTDRGVVRGLDMAWLTQDIYLNIVKIFDLNLGVLISIFGVLLCSFNIANKPKFPESHCEFLSKRIS